MKIERELEDLTRENFIKDGTISGPISEAGVYSLNIEVTDPAKASNFLLLYALRAKDAHILEDTCGFRITSINLYMAKNPNYVLDRLEQIEAYLSNREVSPGIEL